MAKSFEYFTNNFTSYTSFGTVGTAPLPKLTQSVIQPEVEKFIEVNEPPRYCRTCSAIMRLSTKVIAYDAMTCDPLYEQSTSCPRYSFWDSILGRIPHDRAAKKSGNWIWL